jgi:quinol monooxygenase YgiN
VIELSGSNYALVVRFQVREGHHGAFDALVDETLAAMESSEPGTLIYAVHRVEASPDVRVFYELYRDELAFQEHGQMPHVKRFLSEAMPYLSASPEVWRMSPTVGVVLAEPDIGNG